ncbi:MAG: Cof-type HAD-IIB family hydrolase [Flavobacteriales bacterium AspAUS03]
MIQAAFLDVDGTLLKPNHEISPKNLITIQTVQDHHHVSVFLATGRAPQDLKRYYDQLSLSTPAICMNGAYITDFKNDKPIKEEKIPLNLVNAFKKECDQYPVALIYYHGSRWMTTETSPAVEREVQNVDNIIEIIPFKEIINDWKNKNESPHKMGVISNDEKILISTCKTLQEKFQGILSIERSQSNFIEVVMPNVSKGKAIAFLLQIYPFQRENILAIGDSDNDIAMLEWVGIGIAMGNARKYIKKISNDVTLSNLEDGVAHALEKYIISPKVIS